MLTLGLGMLPEKKGKCGNFSQDGDPAFPPVWEPHVCEEEKNYGLFCISGPFTKMFSFWVVLWFVEVGMGDPSPPPSSEKFPLYPVLFDFFTE